MLAFLDTEFTDFVWPDLISIALGSEVSPGMGHTRMTRVLLGATRIYTCFLALQPKPNPLPL